ncbi:M24 family metallopeptidase [Microbacterium yannicii]|uniref:M24 family metallopeptidase n=1 Tax=Microbacterium yannicii TaxID=671622 RepID=A0ABP9MC47_9MICO|nr:M24 family metallopeptidase [Microbacterium yannicii]MCO5952959.1 M24 family metallopeptidase [Microbacterium yannicii]
MPHHGVPFPRPSLQERDRRWAVVRELIDADDLSAVVAFGNVFDRTDVYLAGEAVPGAVVVIPREGEPMLLTGVGAVALLRFDDQGERLAGERWIADLRTGPPPLLIAQAVGGKARVGVIGLGGASPFGGGVPHGAWELITAATPDVEWIEITLPFARARLVKSAEEQELFRHAAEIGEHASRAFLDAARIGARESDVYAAVEAEITRRGGHSAGPGMILRSGNPAFGGPIEWGWAGGEPPILRPGDSIGAEIFACCAGLETQQQMHVQFGADDEHRRLADAARAAYSAGVAAARPGALFSEVYTAMHSEIIAADVWSRPPVIQTVSPGLYNSPMWVNAQGRADLDQYPIPGVVPAEGDFELRVGMTFAFQPAALLGLRQVCVGGAVLVTADGCEELNEIATRSHIVEP